MSIVSPGPTVGVLVNRKSGRNRASLTELRNLIVQSPDVIARETSGWAEAADALREFSSRGVDLVAVAGGDGTLQHVFDMIYNERIFASPPPLAVLAGGTTNMIAYDIGAARKPARELAAVLARMREGRLVEARVRRRLMAVNWHGKAMPSYGLFGGGAAFLRCCWGGQGPDGPLQRVHLRRARRVPAGVRGRWAVREQRVGRADARVPKRAVCGAPRGGGDLRGRCGVP